MTDEDSAIDTLLIAMFGDTVEVGRDVNGDVLVRDPQNPDQPPLRFTPDEWIAFVEGVKKGEFDF